MYANIIAKKRQWRIYSLVQVQACENRQSIRQNQKPQRTSSGPVKLLDFWNTGKRFISVGYTYLSYGLT